MLPIIAYVARIAFVVVTTVTFVIALLAFLRLRNKKTALLMAGFGLFFAHGLLSIPELLSSPYNIDFTDSWHLLLDTVAILLILVGALKD
jgi:hypothetical protein